MFPLPFGWSAKGQIAALFALTLAATSASPAHTEDAANGIEQNQKHLQELIGKCRNDLACLQHYASEIDGMALLGLSLALLKTDPNAALDSFIIAQLRTRYDLQRCTDQSIGGGTMFLFAQLGSDVIQYARRHKMQYLAALKRVQRRDDIFARDRQPVCGGGIDAYAKSLGVELDSKSNPPVKPANEWPTIAATLRQQLAREIEKLDREYAANPPPDYEPPSFPTTVPQVFFKDSRPDKIAAIGVEARGAALAAAAETPAPELLFTIAEAQLDAGDIAGARDTLAAAQALMTKAPKTYDMQHEELAALWARAGETRKGLDAVESVPDPKQRIHALGGYGVALAKAGDIDSVRKLVARIRQSAAPADPGRLTDADMPLQEIAIALAGTGDFADAVREAEYLPKTIGEPMLAKFAAEQCAARDSAAPETLRLAISLAEEPYSQAYLTELIYALAACGELSRMSQAAERASNATLGQIAERLAHQGQQAEAEAIDRIVADRFPSAGDLAGIAERQAGRGDLAGARTTAADAFEMMRTAVTTARDRSRPVYEILDIFRPMDVVVAAQLKAAAYDDAITTAELQDAGNASNTLVRILEAAAKNQDSDVVQGLLPRVLHSLETARLPKETALVNLAKTVGRAGYAAEARDLLERAAQLPNAHCQRAPCINVAEAQVTIGDLDAARAILERMTTPKQRDTAHVMLVRELVDPSGPPGAPRPQHHPGLPPPKDVSGVFGIAAEMAWQIQDPLTRASAMLSLLRSLRS